MKPKIVNRKLGKHKADGLAYIEDNEIHLDTRMAGKPSYEVSYFCGAEYRIITVNKFEFDVTNSAGTIQIKFKDAK